MFCMLACANIFGHHVCHEGAVHRPDQKPLYLVWSTNRSYHSHPTSTLAKEDTSHMFGLKQQQQVHRQLGWKDNATVYAMTASSAGDCSVSGCHSPFQGLISH